MSRRDRTHSKKRRERQERLRKAKHARRQIPQDPDVELDDARDFPRDPACSMLPERASRRVQLALCDRQFETPEERRAFLARFEGLPVEDIASDLIAEDPAEQAQEWAFTAMECVEVEHAVECVQRALELDSECIDALTLRARALATSPLHLARRLEEIVALGRSRLEQIARIEGSSGRFWSNVFARPYLRARQSLIVSLIEADRDDEACHHCWEMIELDRDDPLLIRYFLMYALLMKGEQDQIEQLLQRFPDDRSVVWAWSRPLERAFAGEFDAASSLWDEAESRFPDTMASVVDSPRHSPNDWHRNPAESLAEQTGRVVVAALAAHEQLRAWFRARSDAEIERARKSYTPPVSALLDAGELPFDSIAQWADYPEQFGLTTEHVPELVRLACERAFDGSDEHQSEVYAPVHAWRALAQLRDEAAIEPLVRLMRERSDDDWVLDDLPRVLAEIGPASMDAVKTLLDDRDAEDNARMAAAASLVELATEHEELRPAVAQALRRRLSDCLGNTRYFNGALVNDLLDLGDRDSMPVIERAFAAERVDEWAVGTLANVRAEMLGQR